MVRSSIFPVQRTVNAALLCIFLSLLAGCASPGITLFDLQPTQGDQATATLADGVAMAEDVLATGQAAEKLRAFLDLTQLMRGEVA